MVILALLIRRLVEELVLTVCESLRKVVVRGDVAEEFHALAKHFTVKPDIWVHLIKIAHVGIAHVVDLLKVGSLGLVCILLSLTKHCGNKVVNAPCHMSSELLLLADCWEYPASFLVPLVCARLVALANFVRISRWTDDTACVNFFVLVSAFWLEDVHFKMRLLLAHIIDLLLI